MLKSCVRAGWAVRVTTHNYERLYYAYERDVVKAVALVRARATIDVGELCEAIRLLELHDLCAESMKPGDVKLIPTNKDQNTQRTPVQQLALGDPEKAAA